MFALLLRVFRDFDDIPHPEVLQAHRAQGAFADEQWQKSFRLRRAEWFSSSSPAAGLGRAIFRGIFFGGLFVFDD